MRYTIEVTEKRTHSMLYTVEASSIEEALEKAENGETVDEEEKGLLPCSGEVVDRNADADSVEAIPYEKEHDDA